MMTKQNTLNCKRGKIGELTDAAVQEGSQTLDFRL